MSLEVFKEKAVLQNRIKTERLCGKTIALVPTMGALHAGHLSLVRRARECGDYTIVSIFVNPTQFGAGEDFDKYPRTLERDIELACGEGADAIFAPSVEEMYGANQQLDITTKLNVGELTTVLEGASRPGHFDGVATVVAKLFNITKADFACFGLKDYQQLAVLKKMVRNLDFDVELIACSIVRDSDGLALSSRNRFLDVTARSRALSLHAAIKKAKQARANGEADCEKILEFAKTPLFENGVKLDYFTIVDAENFQTLKTLQFCEAGSARVLVAAKVDDVRLIDNDAI